MDDRWFRLGDHGRYPACAEASNLLQFSIKSLILLTSIIAVLLGAYAALGPSIVDLAVPVTILLGLIFTGVCAHKNSLPIPFWKCFVVYILIFFWGTSSHTGPPTDDEMVFTAIVFGTGIVLSFSSIRDGHWATKIMGLLIFVPIAWSICLHAYNALRNWSNVVDYWHGSQLL